MAVFIAKNEIIPSLTTRWRTKKIEKSRSYRTLVKRRKKCCCQSTMENASTISQSNQLFLQFESVHTGLLKTCSNVGLCSNAKSLISSMTSRTKKKHKEYLMNAFAYPFLVSLTSLMFVLVFHIQ